MNNKQYHKPYLRNSIIKTNYIYSEHRFVETYFKQTSQDLFIKNLLNTTYLTIFIISAILRVKTLQFKLIISNFFLSSNLKDQIEYQQYFQSSFFHFFLRWTYFTILFFCFSQCLLSINFHEILQIIFTITGKTLIAQVLKTFSILKWITE